MKTKKLCLSFALILTAACAVLPLSAQTVTTWNGGTGNWEDGSFWSNGIPNSADADAFIDGGKTGTASVVTMQKNETVGRLTLDAGDTLNLADGVAFFVQNGSFAGSGAIINNGTINFGSSVLLDFFGAGSISGTGTINLNGTGDEIATNTSGDRITIGAGQTIAGNGNLGAIQSAFTNNGVVTANQNGKILFIQPLGGNTQSATDFTNAGAGVARAENGGILKLNGFFSGGSFQALNGSQVQIFSNGNLNASVTNATLSTSGTGVVALDTVTLNNVTNTGNLVANDNATVTLTGTFTNNSTFNLNSTGSGDKLFLSGPVTLAGTGTINLNGAGDQVFANSSLLTIGAGQTIAGAGALGAAVTTFTNNGLITANQNGQTLLAQPATGATQNAGDFTNAGAGLARAENGGILQLNGFFSGGSFQALNGSQVQIFSNVNLNAKVTNATLSTSGTGVVSLDTVTLDNVTNAGKLVANDGAAVTLAGTFTNNNIFNLNSTGSGDTLALSGPVTLAGSGAITFNGAGDRLLANTTGDRLTIGENQAVEGTGNLGAGVTTFTNNGFVTANQSGNTLTIQPGGSNGGPADFTNNGLLEASNGGNLVFSDSQGGTITNNDTFSAIAFGNTGATLTVPARALTNISGTTLTGGTYIASASGGGSATINLTGANITTNAATIFLSGVNSSFAAINNLADNQGSFSLENGRNFTTVGALTNSGTLVTSFGTTLAVTGSYTQSAAGTLAGAGTISATSLTIAGTVSPGDSSGPGNRPVGPSPSGANSLAPAAPAAFGDAPGTLTVIGAFTLQSTARLAFQLASVTGPNDLINLTGNLILDGTLDITALTGFGTGLYDLINYTGTLTDNGLEIGNAPAGYTYNVITTVPGQIDLSVVAVVPEPSTWMLLLGGGALLLACPRLRRVRG